MNADSLGLGKETVTQGGTTPIAVKYDGLSYKYAANTTAAKNKADAITSFKAQISKKVVSAAFTAQYDNTTGSIYYKATIDGKEKRFADASKAKKAYLDDQKAKASAAITNDFQKYVQTSTTAGTTGTTGEVRYGAHVDDYESANKTITKVQDAINTVSTQRSALGALQNRLEHTVANLDNVSENTQSAESRIRDTDMASEMVDYSKNNILAQAGQSMLAQANQSTQGVLSLLQ